MKTYLHCVALTLLMLFSSVWAEDKVENKQIEIKDFKYIPPQLTVTKGTKVTWVNHDEETHTVTAIDKKFRSAGLDTDDKYSYTFDTPGTYQYHCTLHSKMTGTIVVTDKK